MKRRKVTDYARLGLGSVVFMTANMTNIGTDKLMALIITESLVTTIKNTSNVAKLNDFAPYNN